MKKKLFIKPRPGVQVSVPQEDRHLAESGEDLEVTPITERYWRKCERLGKVSIALPTKEREKAAKARARNKKSTAKTPPAGDGGGASEGASE